LGQNLKSCNKNNPQYYTLKIFPNFVKFSINNRREIIYIFKINYTLGEKSVVFAGFKRDPLAYSLRMTEKG
jgi:hypothetical protein